jgi:hypothetical protein
MVGFLANFDYNKRAGIGLLKVIENSVIFEREYHEQANGTHLFNKLGCGVTPLPPSF